MQIIYLLFLIVATNILNAQTTTRTFANYGVKVGYVLGDNGGMIYGVEASYSSMTMFYNGAKAHGFVTSLEYGRKQLYFHIGAEYYYNFLGLEWGPTFIIAEKGYDITHRATVYSWLFVVPYFSYTFENKFDSYKEVGGYLKMSTQLTGSKQWQ